MFGIQKLNKDKISKHIYDNTFTPVLVLDQNQKLVMANPAAEKFFALSADYCNKEMNEFFEITKEDASALLESISQENQVEGTQMIAKPSGAICRIVPRLFREKGKLYIILFVYDKTAELATIERLKSVTSALENELEEKTKQVEAVALNAVTTVANFIDSKDEYNYGHSTRVAKYAQAIALELGWSVQEARNIHYVGLLHDIGKIGVPIEILNKKTTLTSQEQTLVHQHTKIGAEILKDIKTVAHVHEGALYHHERYDGSGYPHGLSEQDIPLVARIIAIADAYDGMVSWKTYRESMDSEQAVNVLINEAGRQFQPELVECFIACREKIEQINQMTSGNDKKEASS